MVNMLPVLKNKKPSYVVADLMCKSNFAESGSSLELGQESDQSISVCHGGRITGFPQWPYSHLASARIEEQMVSFS